jgi:hypothetical protein
MTILSAWHDLDPTERVARLRALQVAVGIFAGPRAHRLLDLLRQAEPDGTTLETCDTELRALPTRIYRNVLATLMETIR